MQQTLDLFAPRIIDDYYSGISTVELSKRFNCNPGTIWYWLNKRNVLKASRVVATTFDKSQGDIKRMHSDGQSAYAMSKKLNVDKTTVLRWLKKLGLSTSSKSTQRGVPLSVYTNDIVKLYKEGYSTNEIATQYFCNGASIWKVLDSVGIKCRPIAKYTVDDTFFDTIDSERKAYAFGWFQSDGNNIKGERGIRLQITDREILEWLKSQLQYTGPILESKPRSCRHKVLYNLAINSSKLSKSLSKLGCVPAKTFLVKFPDNSIVPNNLLNHFVRGYFDGDGSFGCYGKTKRWRIQIVGTKHLCEGIIFSSGCHGIFTQRFPERKKDNWTLTIYRKNDMKKFLSWVYQDATIYLKRKYDKYIEFNNRF